MLKPSEALNRFSPNTRLPLVAHQEKDIDKLRYGFRVGNIGLIMDESLGSEIVSNVSICSIPATPLWFSGVVNIRGNIVPIFDLKMIIGNDEKTRPQQMLVIGKEDKAAAFLIEDLPQALNNLEISSDHLSLPQIFSECINTTFKQDDNIWYEIRFNEFFRKLGKQFNT